MADKRLKTSLLWPFLPPETKHRLRRQHRDEELSRRIRVIFSQEDVSVTLATAIAGVRPGRPVRAIGDTGRQKAGYRQSLDSIPLDSAIVWDGTRLTVAGPNGRMAGWVPERGGLRPGFDAVSVAAAQARPPEEGETGRTGQTLDRVAAIAAVGLAGRHVHRIYLLDAESRALGWLPAPNFAEAEVSAVAAAAGIAYLRYVITLAHFASLRVSPEGLCEAIFPASTEQVAFVHPERLDSDWIGAPTSLKRAW